MKKFLAFWLPTLLHATSVTVFNDSSYVLQAQIVSATGDTIGSMEVQPQHEFKWQQSNENVQTYSVTPFTVIWYCQNGDEYGVHSQVPTGAYANAQASVGRRYCKREKKPMPGQQSPGTSPSQG